MNDGRSRLRFPHLWNTLSTQPSPSPSPPHSPFCLPWIIFLEQPSRSSQSFATVICWLGQPINVLSLVIYLFPIRNFYFESLSLLFFYLDLTLCFSVRVSVQWTRAPVSSLAKLSFLVPNSASFWIKLDSFSFLLGDGSSVLWDSGKLGHAIDNMVFQHLAPAHCPRFFCRSPQPSSLNGSCFDSGKNFHSQRQHFAFG